MNKLLGKVVVVALVDRRNRIEISTRGCVCVRERARVGWGGADIFRGKKIIIRGMRIQVESERFCSRVCNKNRC